MQMRVQSSHLHIPKTSLKPSVFLRARARVSVRANGGYAHFRENDSHFTLFDLIRQRAPHTPGSEETQLTILRQPINDTKYCAAACACARSAIWLSYQMTTTLPCTV